MMSQTSTTDNERIKALYTHRTRASAYGFLASAYRQEPTMRLLKLLASEQPVADGILGGFVATLMHADEEALKELLKELVAEYARLFLAMSARPVPPYESVYTSHKGLLKQEAWQQVVREYSGEGFVCDDGFALPEDHIALELEFMHMLCERCVDGLEAGDEAAADRLLRRQQDFLRQHLLNWAPRFCAAVQVATASVYYKGVAEMTEEVLKADEALLASLLQPAASGRGVGASAPS
jgi:TorA maturation chaperone TorD